MALSTSHHQGGLMSSWYSADWIGDMSGAKMLGLLMSCWLLVFVLPLDIIFTDSTYSQEVVVDAISYCLFKHFFLPSCIFRPMSNVSFIQPHLWNFFSCCSCWSLRYCAHCLFCSWACCLLMSHLLPLLILGVSYLCYIASGGWESSRVGKRKLSVAMKLSSQLFWEFTSRTFSVPASGMWWSKAFLPTVLKELITWSFSVQLVVKSMKYTHSSTVK